MRLRFAIRDQFTLPDITHFLATRALHSKAAGGMRKAGGFALAPQTMPRAQEQHRRGCRTGSAVRSGTLRPPKPRKRRGTPGPTRQLYTRASRLGNKLGNGRFSDRSRKGL
jgi:hypothetical protein